MRKIGWVLLILLWGIYGLRTFVFPADLHGMTDQNMWIYSISHYVIYYPSWYIAHFFIPPDAELAGVLHQVVSGAWVVFLSFIIYIISYKNKKL